ncbi:putative baseplate wedge subunit [Campylobacter phage F358]|uniref:Putative baseplate wedge subunit n=7 Tax=Fletchervirus CPX TaxID=1110702 RepID=A0A7T3N2N3_9CAUD|nr:putative baseplate wedge subunit [Campylobacter phage F357]QPX64097.1 putative baseplate wedge subunit [Campylobacter phage F358]QPX64260.1 putative baseplate wedge subunit [Campylobacter phage F360]QPX64426.1 putative baseplate wedge subunit [Campylobacter phage F361]QPX64589.1 putative baseplate wedge subunit [Campylobacter phage F365]QPX64754.1 putative baseplate wedge subunit [Campylobacter phage F367]QPX64919.1 putative baseplate wedge subunit [Campylobacter phage F368]
MADNILIPYNYDDIKDEVIKLLKNKGYSADVKSSNANLLADILSYLAYSINVNTSFQAGEMLLSTAQYRKNILMGARQLGYEASRKVSYVYSLKIKPLKDNTKDDDNEDKRVYSIPKYTMFNSGSNTYYYMGSDIEVELSNKDITTGKASTITIDVKEGVLHKWDKNKDTQVFTIKAIEQNRSIKSSNKISLYQDNIEENGLEVFVTYIDIETGESKVDEYWEKSDQFMIDADSDTNKKYFVLNNIDYSGVDIYFSISGIGTNLLPGSTVKVTYLESKGSSGKCGDNFSFSQNTYPFNLMEIDKFETKIVGTDEETNSSIKENAPIFHNSANRAVTVRDYIAICNRYTNIYQTQVWGGDEEQVVQLGHIWFSFIPEYRNQDFSLDETTQTYSLVNKNDSYYLKQSELRSNTLNKNGYLVNKGIFDELDSYKIMTMELHNRYPIYMDFDYEIRIIKQNIVVSKNETQDKLFNILKDYFKSDIEIFESSYFHSSVIKRLGTELYDLSGIQVDVSMNIPLYLRNKEPNKDILYIYLAIPFEQIITKTQDDQNELHVNLLPQISSDDFGGKLEVDFKNPIKGFTIIGSSNAIIGTFDVGNGQSAVFNGKNVVTSDGLIIKNTNISFNIFANGTIIGTYKIIYDNRRRFIVIEITDSIVLSSLDNVTPKYIRVKYSDDNLSFYKNTIARLSSVKFVSESDVI